jgi:tRNA(Ile)-lysidine synthase
LDDQAETFLLRLARGSGLDGLSGMSSTGAFPLRDFDDLTLARPLLPFPHARLVATLQARNQEWIEDPSNANDRFARIQIRNLMPALAEAGLSVERIVSATTHLRRAREAIDTAVVVLIAMGTEVSPWGYALAQTEPFAAAPREVALRALARLIEAIGGAVFPPRFEHLEPALEWLIADLPPKGRTLGGCRLVRRDRKTVLIAREETALAQENPVLKIEPRATFVWDGRYTVTLTDGAGENAFELRRLGSAGLKAAGKEVELPLVEPHRIAETTPALWVGERLIAAPLLKFGTPGVSFSANFRGLSRLPGR